MSQKFALLENLEEILPRAFAEDMPDITTEAICSTGETLLANIVAKAPGVICGLPFLPYIFSYRMCSVSVTPEVKDGDVIQAGLNAAIVEGSASGILSAERVALNLLQRLSGIATLTRKFVSSMRNNKVTLLDTRKTLPGWRMLEKYAVRVGGGKNHRIGAFDAYLLKENHIRVVGGLKECVERIHQHREEGTTPVIVEVSSLEELKEVLSLHVDRVMLDNFTLEDLHQAVSLAAGKVPLEVSGGINMNNIAEIAATGVQFISVGAITHSAPALDLSLQVVPLQEKK